MNIVKKPILGIILLCSTIQLVYTYWFLYDQNKIQTEMVPMVDQPHNSILSFLYTTKAGQLIRYGLTKKWFSIAAGIYCDQSISKHHIPSFIETHNINMNEAILQPQEFNTFNEFFTRRLKEHARPIDSDTHSIISPADGNILVFHHCSTRATFPIKSVTFNLEQFLDNKQLAQEFANGTVVIIRISPQDYHRFHFPCTCLPAAPQKINGKFESVNPIAYYTGIQPLTENERRLYTLKKDDFDNILMVSVGALCVGKIIETYQPNTRYEKGAESGYFSFGGSTIVLIFKQGSVEIDKHIITHSQQNKETPIKMGQKIGIFSQKN